MHAQQITHSSTSGNVKHGLKFYVWTDNSAINTCPRQINTYWECKITGFLPTETDVFMFTWNVKHERWVVPLSIKSTISFAKMRSEQFAWCRGWWLVYINDGLRWKPCFWPFGVLESMTQIIEISSQRHDWKILLPSFNLPTRAAKAFYLSHPRN